MNGYSERSVQMLERYFLASHFKYGQSLITSTLERQIVTIAFAVITRCLSRITSKLYNSSTFGFGRVETRGHGGRSRNRWTWNDGLVYRSTRNEPDSHAFSWEASRHRRRIVAKNHSRVEGGFLPPSLSVSCRASLSRDAKRVSNTIQCLGLANVKVHYYGLWKSFCSKVLPLERPWTVHREKNRRVRTRHTPSAAKNLRGDASNSSIRRLTSRGNRACATPEWERTLWYLRE